MPEKDQPRPAQPDIATFEANLFATIFEFHQKAIRLLRESGLDNDGFDLAGKRIVLLLDGIRADMTQTLDFDLARRLDAAYCDLERFVQELPGSNRVDEGS